MARILRFAGLVIAVTFGSAAASSPLSISKEELITRLKAEPVHMAVGQPSSFEDRAGKAIGGFFGALGAAAQVAVNDSSGKQIADKLNIPDPSIEVKAKFEEFLRTKVSLGAIAPSSTESPKGSTGLTFSFVTKLVGLFASPSGSAFAPSRGSRYARAGYEVQAELLDQKSGSTVWTGTCKAFSPESSTYSKENLLDRGGLLLKENMIKAADRCADSLLAELF